MAVDIEANLEAFLGDRQPGARYASFDYCFNYFQDAHAAGEAERLAADDRLTLSCLQLGFYLASWGMMRRRTGLLRRSLRELVPVVQVIAAEPASTWDLDVDSYPEHVDEVMALGRSIRKAYTVNASDILISHQDDAGCLRLRSGVRQIFPERLRLLHVLQGRTDAN
jgi:hypothetical protein